MTGDPFAALRGRLAEGAVLLDFDGTLAPVVRRPEDARPADGAIDAIRALLRAGAHVALVSGRPAAQLVDIAGLSADGLEDLVAFGHYGDERWTPATGVVGPAATHRGIAALRERLGSLLSDAPPGVRVEDKGASLAVHTREAARPDEALDALRPRLSALAAELGLLEQPGKLVLELRAPGSDKGAAVRRHVAETRSRAVLYAGDDHGDIAAFDAVDRLRAQGLAGVLVAVDGAELPTAVRDRADVVVAGPTELVGLLESLAR